MPPEIEPPELAQLLEFAERPRAHDWSLRAALTRYAQPEPQRVSDVLELVRRVESAIRPLMKQVASEGPALLETLQRDDGSATGDRVVGLLRAMEELDRLGVVLVEWAADPARERPDAAVDAVIADVARRLEQLGVPREGRQRPPRQRG